jgi:hypothetical protein
MGNVMGMGNPSLVCSRVDTQIFLHCWVRSSALDVTCVEEVESRGCWEVIDMSSRGTSAPCCHQLAP